MLSRRLARRAVLAAMLCLVSAESAFAQLPGTIDPLGPAERVKNQRQREQVESLARRRLGTGLHDGVLGDLVVLQRLLDERAVARDDEFGQQALGVALGDVMVKNLALEWVVVDDEFGRSRALRYRDTPALFFPVTMISKRVQRDERVSVRALYDEVAREVGRLEDRRNPKRRPITIPARPEPGEAGSDG